MCWSRPRDKPPQSFHDKHAAAWCAYIDFLKTHTSDVSRVISMYERAIAACRYSSTALWMQFIDFVVSTAQDVGLGMRVCERAVRTFPLGADVCCKYVRTCMLASRDVSDVSVAVSGVVVSMLTRPLVDSHAYGSVVMHHCDYHTKRLRDALQRSPLDVMECVTCVANVRMAFESGERTLTARCGDVMDYALQVYEYHAQVEMEYVTQLTAAGEDDAAAPIREVYEACLQFVVDMHARKVHSEKSAHVWHSYARFERGVRLHLHPGAGVSVELERSVYKRAVQVRACVHVCSLVGCVVVM